MIRLYRESDKANIIECLTALQDYEHEFEPRRLPGSSIADSYVDTLLSKCDREHGAIFVAEEDQRVVGFVCVFPYEPFDPGLNEPATVALISDVIVLPEFRGKGIGKELMGAAESFAKESGADQVSLFVLANNPARLFYRQNGYSEYYVKLIKPLT